VPSELDAVIARCLEIDAPERFQTVAELAWALSTVGAPHARDSAARISRVFDKQSSEHPEETPSGTLRSTVPPPVVNAVRRGSRSRRARERRTLAAVVASATMFGAASVFTVLAARARMHATTSEVASEETHLSAPHVSDDAAVSIALRVRPRAQTTAVSARVVPPAVKPDAGMGGALATEPVRERVRSPEEMPDETAPSPAVE